MGTWCFSPASTCCTAAQQYPLTPVGRGGAVELGWRLWNWWSRPPRPRRGILIFTERGQSNARWHVLTLAYGPLEPRCSLVWPRGVDPSTAEGYYKLLPATQCPPPCGCRRRLVVVRTHITALVTASQCQAGSNVMFPPSATLLLVRLGRGCQSGASPSRLAAAICFDCLSKRKCRFLPDQSSPSSPPSPLPASP